MSRFFRILTVNILILFVLLANAEARPLRMCTHQGFEPYVIGSAEKIKGIDIEIILKILNNLKQPATITAYPWQRLIAQLKNGQCDMGFSLFDTDERRDFVEFLFSIPMHYSTFSVFVRKEDNFQFNRISDFFNKKVAHNRGFALTVGFEQAIADGKIQRILFDNADNAIKMLETGRIDAILDNEARFRYYLKKKGHLADIRSLNVPFMPHRPAFLVTSRQSDFPDLAQIKEKFEVQLKHLHLDGSILAITSKYIN